MPADIKLVRAWRDGLARAAERRGEPTFMGKPCAWFEDTHWFCRNGHVSGMFLKSDRGDLCLACHEHVVMGPAMTAKEFWPILKRMDRVNIFFRSSKTKDGVLSDRNVGRISLEPAQVAGRSNSS